MRKKHWRKVYNTNNRHDKRKKYWCRVYNTKTQEIYCVMMWKLPHLTKHQYHMIIAEMYETLVIDGDCQHVTAVLLKGDDMEKVVQAPYGYDRYFDYRFISSFWAAADPERKLCKIFGDYHHLRTMSMNGVAHCKCIDLVYGGLGVD